MMKSFSLLTFSALFAGGLFAFAIQSNDLVMQVPGGLAPVLGSRLAAEDSTRFDTHPALGMALSPGSASGVAESKAAGRNASSTLLLRERVVLLSSRGVTDLELPPGTAVRLLATHGAFLVVRHAQEILTIPRTAVVSGVTGAY